MILADQTIRRMLDEGRLVIEPIDDHAIQPASIDCRLGSTFLIADDKRMHVLSLRSKIIYHEVKEPVITLPPHSFLLATTKEYVRLPEDVTAFVEGRSSIGRMGLFIQNAGWVDPGFRGRLTLELYNANSLPIRLEAGRRICQLVFCRMDIKASTPYAGKYQGQKTTTGSRIQDDEDVDNKAAHGD